MDGATIVFYYKTKARDMLLKRPKEQNNDNDTTVNINSNVPKENKAKVLCTRFYLCFMLFLVDIQLETWQIVAKEKTCLK